MANLVQVLSKIASNPEKAFSDARALQSSSRNIAESLRWTGELASLEPVQLGFPNTYIHRGLIGPQPATVFAAASRRASVSLLNNAALYAYHAAIHWGLVITADGATLFNSHWIRNNNWYQLPFVHWSDLKKKIGLIEALTPEGVSSGDLEKLAAKEFKPDGFLAPVDDALVDRLDFWRGETLRFSSKVSGIDEKLQTLFAQFFVLRAVEDRQLAPELATLRSVCSDEWEVDQSKLHSLLNDARTMVGSELFEMDALADIPSRVIGGIVRDLYVPHSLPRTVGTYNFSWIDADILGSAYEKYLATVLTVLPPPPQLTLFDQPIRDVDRISVRKLGGVYYTPPFLVRYLTESCLRQYFEQTTDRKLPKIADLACGSGSFLVAACDSLIRRLRAKDPKTNWARELVNKRRLFGVDIDRRAVTMARLSLWLRFAEEPNPLPLPRLEKVVVHGDSLSADFWNGHKAGFDIIIGNPPFIAGTRATTATDLSRFKTAQGRFDYSYLFLELAINISASNGYVGLVMGNRLFRNRDASAIREIVCTRTDILQLLDFGSTEVFEGTQAYIGTIVARKKRPDLSAASPLVRVVNIKSVSVPFLVIQLLKATQNASSDVISIVNDIEVFDIPQPSGNMTWLLIPPSARRKRNRLEESGDPLAASAGLYQGIRTGANDIFMATIDSTSDSFLAKLINGLGDSALVEKSLLHPVVFGSDIQRYDVISTNRYIVYPYRNNKVLSEAELKTHFPYTYQYLLRYRDLLSERTSLNTSGLKWYELIRKRDQAWLTSPKLLTRDLATETSFAIDPRGETHLVGGTAVIPLDPDLLWSLLAYLNSAIVNEYLQSITPSFRAGFQKFEPQHLQQIPVPSNVATKSQLSAELATLAHQVVDAQNSSNDEAAESARDRIDEMLSIELGL